MRQFVVPAVVAWAIAQTLKVIFYSVRQRRLNLRVLAAMGGMPSSHAALVTGLTAAIGRVEGVQSAIFAVALIFSLVVMYDAQGVRRAAGRQAAVLNRLIDDLVLRKPFQEERLRELVGHTPFEVLVGCLIGLAVGLSGL